MLRKCVEASFSVNSIVIRLLHTVSVHAAGDLVLFKIAIMSFTAVLTAAITVKLLTFLGFAMSHGDI
jgi:hypothetical protein